MMSIPQVSRRYRFFAAGILCGLFAGSAAAGVVTDGTLGAGRTLTGPDFVVGEDLGKRAGNNLFHSFAQFSIRQGESATFTGAADIRNVISRVTGGDASSIDGLLRSEIGTAEFYFINPHGVIFGPNAQVDVPAGFHVATADEVRFADGAAFRADDPAASTLSVEAPQAFGFRSATPGTLTIDGSALLFQPEAAVTLAAGTLTLEGAYLESAGGSLLLAAQGSAGGEVRLDGAGAGGRANGALTVDGSGIYLDGDGGGRVVMRAGDIRFDAGYLGVNNLGDRDAGTAVLAQAAELAIVNGAYWAANSFGGGRAGDVRIEVAGGVEISGGGAVASDAYGAGAGGQILLEAESLRVAGGGGEGFTGIAGNSNENASGNAGGVTIDVSGAMTVEGIAEVSSGTFGAADGGQVTIHAGSLRVDGAGAAGFTGIAANTDLGAGRAGGVEITVDGRLEVVNGGEISSGTFGSGDAGRVVIRAGEVRIVGNADGFTGIASNANSGSGGNAGSLDVAVAGEIELLAGGEISSSTWGLGDAGQVVVQAGDLRVDAEASGLFAGIASQANEGSEGDAGSLSVRVEGLVALSGGGKITSSTHAAGDAGAVAVAGGTLHIEGDDSGILSEAAAGSGGRGGSVNVAVTGAAELAEGGSISSDTYAAGDAGQVTVTAGSLRLDDRNADDRQTGIWSDANADAFGNAGQVTVAVAESLTIVDGATITSTTRSVGDAGTVSVSAGEMTIDAHGSPQYTGIFSNAGGGSTGQAGSVLVSVASALELLSGGEIASRTFASGAAGAVSVSAGSLRIDRLEGYSTGITTAAESGSSGNAGEIAVAVEGLLSLSGGGVITSSAEGLGDAGGVAVAAGGLTIDGLGSGSKTGILSEAAAGAGDAGEVTVSVAGAAQVLDGGSISSSTWGDGDAGRVTVSAAGLYLDDFAVSGQFTGIWSEALESADGDAGEVFIDVAGALELWSGAIISTDTWGSGSAGQVRVNAGSLYINGDASGQTTGISSVAESEVSGDAGAVEVRVAGDIEILNGGAIASDTWGYGDAGSVRVVSDGLRIDDFGAEEQQTGIWSDANWTSLGNAGTVEVTVAGRTEIWDGGLISSNTFAGGNAGSVRLHSGELAIDNFGRSGQLTGIWSDAKADSSGRAGEVAVTVDGLLEVWDGGLISSSTWADGDAGSVTVAAGDVSLSGFGSSQFTGIGSLANAGSTGQGGAVRVDAAGLLELTGGGVISSSTWGTGDAGTVEVAAATLRADGQRSGAYTGVASTSELGAAGGGGSVTVTAGDGVELLGGGVISSSTWTDGDAGSVQVAAPRILIDGQLSREWAVAVATGTGIYSTASGYGNGQTGSVGIAAGKLTLLDGGEISIASSANVPEAILAGFTPRRIEIAADRLEMRGWSRISATSAGNVPASDIRLEIGRLLLATEGSEVTTASLGGDGGEIVVGGGIQVLQDGLITTSVEGAGSGGDIGLSADALILDSGFIQANTSAGAKGGDIRVATPVLVVPGNQRLVVGGASRQYFWPGSGVDVIQAAAPEGVSGDIQVSAVALDLSGALFNLRAQYAGLGGISESPCQVGQGAIPSSLVRGGYGGIPEERSGDWHGLDVPVGLPGPLPERDVPRGGEDITMPSSADCWPM